MEILVLGTGCKNCKKLEENVGKAVIMSGRQDIVVKKVEDMAEIMKYGVMRMPALVIDGKVKISSRVPDVKEIRSMI